MNTANLTLHLDVLIQDEYDPAILTHHKPEGYTASCLQYAWLRSYNRDARSVEDAKRAFVECLDTVDVFTRQGPQGLYFYRPDRPADPAPRSVWDNFLIAQPVGTDIPIFPSRIFRSNGWSIRVSFGFLQRVRTDGVVARIVLE